MYKEVEIVFDYCEYCHNADKNCDTCPRKNQIKGDK
jgi:hypothetical protein